MKVFSICTTVLALSCLSITSFAASTWDYSQQKNWGNLDKNFIACSTGKQQSPINLINAIPVSNHKLHFHYHDIPFITAQLKPSNLDHNIAQDKTDYLTFDDKKYIFEGFHFHMPSEHEIKGKKYAGEIHLIHEDQQHHFLVIGLFIKEGSENKGINQILAISNKAKNKHINPLSLLPNKRHYFTYAGSLTTPPCSEPLTWIVMQEPIVASKQQLEALEKNVLRYHARDLQALNGRIIEEQK